MPKALRTTVACLALSSCWIGCAGVHDRQVLNPSRDWTLAGNRRERVARLKAPFVTLGNKLRSLDEPIEDAPAPDVGPAEAPLYDPLD